MYISIVLPPFLNFLKRTVTVPMIFLFFMLFDFVVQLLFPMQLKRQQIDQNSIRDGSRGVPTGRRKQSHFIIHQDQYCHLRLYKK